MPASSRNLTSCVHMYIMLAMEWAGCLDGLYDEINGGYFLFACVLRRINGSEVEITV